MNAIMRIDVRVMQRDAIAQLKAIQSTVSQINRSVGGGMPALVNKSQLTGFNSFVSNLRSSSTDLIAWGKNVQWTGRQLEYRFTLPLLLAGGAALDFALKNEAAMTRLQRVYTDGSQSASQLHHTLGLLDRAFTVLSDRYGVQKSEVIDIGVAWASAGAKGVQLAKATELTLQVMTLGGQTYQDATTSLLTLRAAYGLTVDQLGAAVDAMAVVADQVNATFPDFIEAVTHGGAAARTAGIDIQHFTAMVAALVPTAGTASIAGTSLKTIISRLFAPTKAAADMMALLGINTQSASWEQLNGSQRVETLARAVNKLTPAQQILVTSTIAGRRQYNSLLVLLHDVTLAHGQYQTALGASSDKSKTAAIAAQKIGAVLASQPQAFKIALTTLENALAQIIIPLVPSILGVVRAIVGLVAGFTHLSPGVQHFILLGLAMLAVLGPIVSYMGAFANLIGITGKGLGAFLSLFTTTPRIPDPTGGLEAAAAASKDATASQIADAEALQAAREEASTAATTVEVANLERLGVSSNEAWIAMAARGTTAYDEVVAAAAAAEAARIAGEQAAALAADMAAATYVDKWLASIALVEEARLAARSPLEVALAAQTESEAAAAAASAEAWQAAADAIIAAGGESVGAWSSAMTGMMTVSVQAALVAAAAWNGITPIMAASGAEAGAAFDAGLEATLLGGWETLTLTAGEIGAAIAGALLAPEVIIPVAIGVILVAALIRFRSFRDGVVDLFRNIGDFFVSVWNALPQSVQNALEATVRIVAAAAKAIWSWLQQLNPFARHSPSLVDNVRSGTKQIGDAYTEMHKRLARLNGANKSATSHSNPLSNFNPFTKHSPSLVESVQLGIDQIAKKYRSLQGLSVVFAGAVNGLKLFKTELGDTTRTLDLLQLEEKKQQILKFAPGAGGAVDGMIAEIMGLERALPALEKEYAAQEAVTSRWKVQLDAVDSELAVQQARLQTLSDVANLTQSSLQAGQQALSQWANTPIQGMQQMSDLIFGNDQKQKQLTLDMLKMQDATGVAGNVADAYAKINGQLEQLRGKREQLRLAGAGSDALAGIDQQISGLQGQHDSLDSTVSKLHQMQTELDALGRKGQELNLEQSLKFDPLTRQIDQVANGMKEMPFDEILKKVIAQRAENDRLTAAYDRENIAVRAQQAIVDALQIKHDLINQSYIVEQQKLDALGASYDGVTQQIQDMTQALDDLISKQSAAKQGGGGAASLAAAGAGKFKIPGGNSGFGPSGNLDALVKQWEKQMGNIHFPSPFDGLKHAWNSTFDWLKHNVGVDIGAGLGAVIGAAFGPLGVVAGGALGAALGAAVGFAAEKVPWGKVWNGLKDAGRWINRYLQPVESFFERKLGPVVSRVGGFFKGLGRDVEHALGAVNGPFRDIEHAVAQAGGAIGKELAKWGQLFAPFKQDISDLVRFVSRNFHNLVAVIKIVLAPFIVWFRAAWETLTPVVKLVFNLLRVIVMTALRVILAVFRSSWHAISGVVVGALKIIQGVVVGALRILRGIIMIVLSLIRGDWSGVWSGLVTVVSGIWSIISGVVSGGMKIVMSIIFGALGLISGVWRAVWKGLGDGLSTIFDGIKSVFVGAVNGVITILDAVISAIDKFHYHMHIPWPINKDIDIGFNIPQIPHIGGGGGGSGQSQGAGGSGHHFLAAGGVVRAARGGVPAVLAEAGRSELVAPLPPGFDMGELVRLMQSLERTQTQFIAVAAGTVNLGARTHAAPPPPPAGGDTHLHFHNATFEFPNVKDGDDAESFLKHLESLAT